MSYKAVERALEASYADQASNKPLVDRYVYRAALGFIATQDSSDDQAQIEQFNLHPLDTSNLMQIARFMKNNHRHGRIPSRVDTINQRILYSPSGKNVVRMASADENLNSQETKTA